MSKPNKTTKVSITEQNRRLREKLKIANKKTEEQQLFIQRLCQTIGYDRLANEWDKKKVKNRWVAEWLKPLHKFINENMGKPITGNFRNDAINIAEAVIMQLAILGNYGIKLPLDPRPGDFETWKQKNDSQLVKKYPPCVICGETRITHQCHIIPRSQGGKYHRDNLIDMCPLHHHLFDHGRLTKEEWSKLENAVDGKMEAAIKYVKTVQFGIQKYFWGEINDAAYTEDTPNTPDK